MIQLAILLKGSSDELLTLWLAEQIYELVKGEKVAFNALNMVKSELK